ncbi:hypothetical protein [Rubrivivax albus]|uniref:Tetratricopeptide repeat protein n=1 Tax=Rubrivivax albus TaxID=2499835 RepID=A0A437JW54_9BURK|nr:hypothetical protein [Rubrivivax albus]RVT51603.1 hypothetical protein ENE75_12360 [Rubrivivax albus]
MNPKHLGTLLHQAYGSCITGNVRQARSTILEIRRNFVIEKSPVHAAETMLIEGVLSLYSGEIDSGCDRLRRAIAIGQFFPGTDLSQVACGWLSLACYNAGDIIKSAEYVGTSLESGEVKSQRARLRISTTAANLSEYAGLPDAARRWNAASRRAATALGIPGVLTSVIFSMAVASLDASQRKRFNNVLSDEDAQETLGIVQSAIGYDARAGLGAQPNLHRLALGMSFSICGRYREALNALQCYLEDANGSRQEDAVCGFVEFALAEMNLSRQPLAQDLLQKLEAIGVKLREPLERAAWLSALEDHYVLVGDIVRAQAYCKEKIDALEHRERLSSELSKLLERKNLMSPPAEW